MTKFRPIKASDGDVWHDYKKDFDAHYDQDAHGALALLLLGHAVSKVAVDHLLLDDGTLLKIVGHEGGCSCNAGCYDLTALNGVENIITSVEFEDDPDEGWGDGGGTYRIFVFAGDQRINLATFEGSDGNGYYGTGYRVLVRLPGGAS
jgi:hypothetical protein